MVAAGEPTQPVPTEPLKLLFKLEVTKSPVAVNVVVPPEQIDPPVSVILQPGVPKSL